MIGNLKKIKLEKGGDDLQLAVVKSDNIDLLKRFRNKSEPTWLFISHKKLVNCAFGSNVPHLMAMITKELDIERKYRDGQVERQFFELTDLCACELKRFNAKVAIEEEANRIEKEAAEKSRRDYITFVTNEIIEHSPDMGITLLMPHTLHRDLYKKLHDQGEKFGINAKDKKNIILKPVDLEILHFEITNPMPSYILNHLYTKESMVICWKLPDSAEGRCIQESLEEFRALVSSKEICVDEHSNVEKESKTSFIMKSITVQLTDDEYEEIKESEEHIEVTNVVDEKIPTPSNEADETKKNEPSEIIDEEEKIDEDQTDKELKDPVTTESAEVSEETINNNENEGEEINENDADEEPVKATEIETDNKIESNLSIDKYKGRIPPMWTPSNKRTNAAFIYYFFRHLTDHYLPPDPIPEPPHLTMCFEAYKRRDIMDVIDEHRTLILAYGYFTCEEPENTKLIANSTFKYHLETPTIVDKLILKVVKNPNDAVAALSDHGPSYVSRNTEIGKHECKLFFPNGYKNASETGVEEPVDEEKEIVVKKKRRRKANKNKDEKGPKEVEEEDDGDDDDEDDDDSKKDVGEEIVDGIENDD